MNNLAYDIWEPGINDELENEQGSMYAYLNKSSKEVKGRRTYMKFLVGRSLGINNIPEGGDFPDAGDPIHDEVEISLNRLAATTEFTLEEIDLLNGRDAGALPVVQHKLDDLVRTLRRDVIRQTWGDGTGTLARVGSFSAGPPDTVVLSVDAANYYDRNRYLWLEENGMRVDFATPELDGVTGEFTGNYTAVTGTGFTVVGIDRANDTVTVADGTGTPLAGDHIVRSKNVVPSNQDPNWSIYQRGDGSVMRSLEFDGIMSAIQIDNVYLSKDRTDPSVAYWWKSNVIDNGGTPAALSLDKILSLINTLNTRTGKSPLTSEHAFFSNLGVWSAYGEQVEPRVRYQGYQKIDRGWPELEIFGMPFYADIHAPHNQLFLIHRPSFQYRVPKYQDRGTFQFQNMDGSMWRYVPGSGGAGYRAIVQSHLTGMMTLICQHPRMSARLDDIIEVGQPVY